RPDARRKRPLSAPVQGNRPRAATGAIGLECLERSLVRSWGCRLLPPTAANPTWAGYCSCSMPRSCSEVGQAVFHQFNDDGAREAGGDLERAQCKAGFEQFFPGFLFARGIHVNFFPSQRGQRNQRADGAGRGQPRESLLPKRSSESCRKIQFLPQTE